MYISNFPGHPTDTVLKQGRLSRIDKEEKIMQEAYQKSWIISEEAEPK